MVAVEAILEASATMIVGVLFVVTLAQALHVKYVGRFAFVLFLCGVVPFSFSAIFALYDSLDLAKTICMFGFLYFAVLLLTMAAMSFETGEEEK